MKSAEETQNTPVSDKAVKAKTGKNWAEWFAILDEAGAQQLKHKEIAEYLYGEHEVDGWWAQTITVGYEQARGMRDKHEMPGGYKISVSRTVAVPVAVAYEAWQDKKSREQWLPDTPIFIRKATANKSMRITWTDEETSLSVNFYSKGESKSQVVVEHSKLPNAEAAGEMKAYWGQALDRFRETVEA